MWSGLPVVLLFWDAKPETALPCVEGRIFKKGTGDFKVDRLKGLGV